MKVLFVDDEKGLLDQSKIFLEREDESFEIDTSISAKNALRKFEDDDYDVIISDYQMPDMNGLEFLDILRNQKDSEIPFILFTGKGEEEVAMEALNNGAERYIKKENPIAKKYNTLARTMRKEVERKDLKEDLKKSYKLVQNTIDTLPSLIVLLDDSGRLIKSNEAWERFDEENGLIGGLETGDNYLRFLEESSNKKRNSIKRAYEGLMDLKDDKQSLFTMNYSIFRDGKEEKYLMRGTKFYVDSEEYMVVSHLKMTSS